MTLEELAKVVRDADEAALYSQPIGMAQYRFIALAVARRVLEEAVQEVEAYPWKMVHKVRCQDAIADRIRSILSQLTGAL